MKACRGVDVWIHVFLTSALPGGEWSASRSDHFTTGGRTPGIHWVRGWMGPRTVLDDVEKWKSRIQRDPNFDPSAMQSVASRYTDCAIPAPTETSSLYQINAIVC
jgi:hypothetical protein